MNTKNALRTNLEALHLSPKQLARQLTPQPGLQPTKQPPEGAIKPARKPRSGRTQKKSASPARPASKGGEGGEGDGDDAASAEGAAFALSAADAGEGGAAFALSAADADEGGAAFARVRADLEALPRDELRRITVNVPRAVVLVLGALPKMLGLRDAMRDELVRPPLEVLDKLRDYALVAAYAHARALPRDEGETRLRTLLSEAVPLRERLLASAKTLATFGLLDARAVEAVRQGTGHVDTAQDLSSLVGLLRDAGPEIVAKTPLTPAELSRAGQLGSLLLEALGQRQSGADGAGDPGEADERLVRAFALMARAYNECRRVISFVRWRQGDADVIAPPLGHSRRPARRSPVDEPVGDEPGGDELDPIAPGEGEADAG